MMSLQGFLLEPGLSNFEFFPHYFRRTRYYFDLKRMRRPVDCLDVVDYCISLLSQWLVLQSWMA
jgi:hypothetical protein